MRSTLRAAEHAAYAVRKSTSELGGGGGGGGGAHVRRILSLRPDQRDDLWWGVAVGCCSGVLQVAGQLVLKLGLKDSAWFQRFSA